MTLPLTLLLVRHGQTERNARGIAALHPVALVTHGDTIRAAQAVVAGLGPAQLPAITPQNGSVTRLEPTR